MASMSDLGNALPAVTIRETMEVLGGMDKAIVDFAVTKSEPVRAEYGPYKKEIAISVLDKLSPSCEHELVPRSSAPSGTTR